MRVICKREICIWFYGMRELVKASKDGYVIISQSFETVATSKKCLT